MGLAHQGNSRRAVRRHGVPLPGLTLVKLVLLYGGTYAFVFGLMMIVLRGLLRLGKKLRKRGQFAPAVWAISRKSNHNAIANIPVVYDHD